MTGTTPVTEFSEAQRRDLVTLLSQHLTLPSIHYLGQSLLGTDAVKQLGNDIGDTAKAAARIVDALNAERKVAAAIAQLLDDPQIDRRVISGLNRILMRMTLDAGENLEAFDNEVEPFFVTEEFEKVLPKVRRAVCAVGLDAPYKKLVGTGILVAPSLVITNFHVIEPFLKVEDGTYVEGASGDKIHFFFDYGSPPQPSIPPGKGVSTQVVRAKTDKWLKFVRPFLGGDGTDNPQPFTDQLDCALIELERPIGMLPVRAGGGLPRGWLPVAPTGGAVVPGAKVILFQHPGARHQVFDVGEVHGTAIPSRIWYWLNSARGSSGGAAVDSEGRLFALHNAAVNTKTVPKPADRRRLNQGIWIETIAIAVEAHCPGCLTAPSGADVPFWSLNDNLAAPEPALGRTAFREHVTELLGNTSLRVIVVTGEENQGVRFSKRLLRRIVGTQVPIIEFSPDELGALSPKQFLGALRNGLPMTKAAPAIPDAKPEEDLAHWITTDLAEWLFHVVAGEQANAKAQFPAWVVINTIDKNGKAMSSWANGLRECIAAMIGVRDNDKAAFDIPHLRWLFLTRPTEILSLGNLPRREEDLTKDDRHAESFAQCMQWAWHALDEHDVISPQFLERQARGFIAEKPHDPRRAVLAEEVRKQIRILLAGRGAS